MILAAHWYHTVLAFFFAVLAILLMIVILLQRGRGVGLAGAFGGSGGGTAFGAKTGDVLTWVTIVGATLLLTFTVVLNYVFVEDTAPLLPAPASVPQPGGAPPGAAPTPPPGTPTPMPITPTPISTPPVDLPPGSPPIRVTPSEAPPVPVPTPTPLPGALPPQAPPPEPPPSEAAPAQPPVESGAGERGTLRWPADPVVPLTSGRGIRGQPAA